MLPQVINLVINVLDLCVFISDYLTILLSVETEARYGRVLTECWQTAKTPGYFNFWAASFLWNIIFVSCKK